MNSPTPELENGNEISRLLESDLEKNRQQGLGKALQNVTLGIVNTRFAVNASVEHLNSVVRELNDNIKLASASSGKLAVAVKNATVAAAVIAGLGLVVATIQLIEDLTG